MQQSTSVGRSDQAEGRGTAGKGWGAQDGAAEGEARRIIGGQEHLEFLGKTKWVVLLEQAGSRKLTCTGSIIGKRWVVTAAHCFLNKDNDGFVEDQGTSLIYDCTELCEVGSKGCSCKRAYATDVYQHPCYTASTNQDHDDIALIRTDVDLIADWEFPVAVHGLNGTFEIKAGEQANVSGFGTVSNDPQARSQTLMRVSLPVVSEETCRQANPSTTALNFVDFANTVCAGGREGKDSCTGDSGGPISMMLDGDLEWVVGVLSIGSELPDDTSDCAVEGRYGVYTRTDKYANWIYKTMTGEGFECACSTTSSTRDPCTGVAPAIYTPMPLAQRPVKVWSAGPSSPRASHLTLLFAAALSLALLSAR